MFREKIIRNFFQTHKGRKSKNDGANLTLRAQNLKEVNPEVPRQKSYIAAKSNGAYLRCFYIEPEIVVPNS